MGTEGAGLREASAQCRWTADDASAENSVEPEAGQASAVAVEPDPARAGTCATVGTVAPFLFDRVEIGLALQSLGQPGRIFSCPVGNGHESTSPDGKHIIIAVRSKETGGHVRYRIAADTIPELFVIEAEVV